MPSRADRPHRPTILRIWEKKVEKKNQNKRESEDSAEGLRMSWQDVIQSHSPNCVGLLLLLCV